MLFMDAPRFFLAVLCAAALAACASTRPAKPPLAKRPSSEPPTPLVWPKNPNPPTKRDLAKTKNSKPLKRGMFFFSDSKVKRGTLVFFSTPYSGRYGLQYDSLLCGKMMKDGWDVIWSQVDPAPFDIKPGESAATLPQVAEVLARRIDTNIAGEASNGYMPLSLLQFLSNGEVSKRPIVYFGVSAGAFVIPALAARYGPPDALILVCGTASVGELLFTTGLLPARPKIKLVSGRAPSDAERRRLAKLTRAATRLEPEKLAPFLQNTPTLLITAGQDLIVPTRLQDDLDAALGQPERWHYPGGHNLTCYRLPAQWPRLNKWIERALAMPSRQQNQPPSGYR